VYDIEREVGRGIEKIGVPRKEAFARTKLWCNKFYPDDVESALKSLLEVLDTSYVDVLMMQYACVFARGEEMFLTDANGKMILGKTTYVDT
jgi:alcohol dehydrogenase (NADP+)